ncbi:hypothetical protein ACXQGU_001246 [Campylobacter jejuni]|uniref:hypothetical protein n=1 Tax=Campylobacter sp. BCW_6462 TaxID=1903579 RepID=UPI000A95EF37|nr:hypothetical protein [Campylobacter sp. BCW_6462]
MNKFSIVLTLLLCGSCALALDPNLEKTKSATGIDLPTAKWLFWEIKFLMKQANMWVHKPKILKKDLREIIFLVQAVMLMVEVCKINRVL